MKRRFWPDAARVTRIGAGPGAADSVQRVGPAQAAEGHVSRRSAGVAVEFEGERVRPFAGQPLRGPAYAAAAAQLLEFAPDGTFVARSARTCMPWSYGHTVRVDRSDNIWVIGQGIRTWS